MRTYLLAFVVTAVLAALLTPVARRIAVKIGAVSMVGGRNVNAHRVPRLGGIAIAFAFACTFGLMLCLDSSGTAKLLQAQWLRMIGLLGGALICFLLGVLDDTRRVRALYKLYAQIAAALLAYACGFRIGGISLPFAGDLSMGMFSLPITVLWIVGVVNAINLIDGLDGLAGGIVFFAGLTNFIVSMNDPLVATVMATMLGAVLGFLFFNFNPARIFMGDSGSYFLGFVLGTVSIGGQKATTTVAILVPMIALGVPIFDTLFTIVRRFLERRPIFSPDRGHIHHRLLDMGLTHRRAVLTLYGVSIVFTLAAITMEFGHSWFVGGSIVVTSVVAIGLYRAVGYFDYLVRINQRKERVRAPDTEVLRRSLLPIVASLREVKDEQQVLSMVEKMLPGAGLAEADLRGVQDQAIRSWKADPDAERDELVSARFPIGNDALANAVLVFRWRAAEVNPQTEILLQVAVDAVADALTRAESALAPRPREAPVPPEEAPVASARASVSA